MWTQRIRWVYQLFYDEINELALEVDRLPHPTACPQLQELPQNVYSVTWPYSFYLHHDLLWDLLDMMANQAFLQAICWDFWWGFIFFLQIHAKALSWSLCSLFCYAWRPSACEGWCHLFLISAHPFRCRKPLWLPNLSPFFTHKQRWRLDDMARVMA